MSHKIVLNVTDELLEEFKQAVEKTDRTIRVINPIALLTFFLQDHIDRPKVHINCMTEGDRYDLFGSDLGPYDHFCEGMVERR